MRRLWSIAAFVFWCVALVFTGAFLPADQPTSAAEFVDVAGQAGVNFVNVCGRADRKDYILESTGSGVAIFDVDRDGLPDLFFVNGGVSPGAAVEQEPTNRLYRNSGDGRFVDITERAGLKRSGWGQAAVAADYDNDGWEDLFVTYYGANVLYHNNGNGTFTDVTAKAGLPTTGTRWSTGAAFLDYNRDGNVDLFVTTYVDFDWKRCPVRGSNEYCTWKNVPVFCGPRGLPGSANLLYKNLGNGRFADVSESAGVSRPSGHYGLGVVSSDFDNDGYPDIYVACDSAPNILYRNQADGTFKDIAVEAGAAYNADGRMQAGMGVAAGDYDHDGKFDLFVTNFSEDSSTLYHNDGLNFFSDVTLRAGFSKNLKYLGWGTAFADVDSDGWKDLIVANGHVFPEADQVGGTITYNQRMLLYRNLANGRFADVSDISGGAFREPRRARGLAVGDLDNDGTLEILINNIDDRASLLRNSRPAGNALIVQTIGSKSNRDGIGARVTVTVNGRRESDEVRSGGSYLSNNDPRLHFGMGTAGTVTSLTIDWPSGLRDQLSNIPGNQVIEVKEGSGIIRSTPFTKRPTPARAPQSTPR